MAKRIRSTKVGDIFVCRIDENHKRFFQYIVSDLTQLNSDVIRVFKRVYANDENPTLEEILKDEIDFYAHCDTRAGIREELWEKIGNSPEVGDIKHIIFKGKWDYTNPTIQTDWYIWKINDKRERGIGLLNHIGFLRKYVQKKLSKCHLGLVFSTESIFYRIKHGKYRGVFGQYS